MTELQQNSQVKRVSTVDVQFINCQSNSEYGKTGSASAVLNSICFPQRGERFVINEKTYSYQTDMDLKEGDIVLVDANGVLSMARVVSISSKYVDFATKKVLAVIHFSKSIQNNASSLVKKILQNLDKDEVADILLKAISESNSDFIKKMLKEYNATSIWEIR